MPCQWILNDSNLAASLWTSSMRPTQHPFAVPPVQGVAVRKVDARCTKVRRCVPCASWDLTTCPKGSRNQTVAFHPCPPRMPVPDARIVSGHITKIVRRHRSRRNLMSRLTKTLVIAAFYACGINASIAQAQDKWDSAPWIEGKPITLKAGYNTVRQYPHARAIERFANRVAERTGENLQSQTFPSEQAGNERQMLDSVILGNLDIAKVSTGVISTVVPDFGVFDLPYVFRDLNHMMATTKSKVGQDLAAKLEARNVKILFWMEQGTRSFYTASKPCLLYTSDA